jgi:hypothetical protein
MEAGNNIIVDCAAIKQDGKVWSIKRPARHHDIIRLMIKNGLPKPIKGEQGFVLSNGLFVDRITAKRIASNANQLLPRASKSTLLFSEDMW